MTSQLTTFLVDGPIRAHLSTRQGAITMDLREGITEATVELHSRDAVDLEPVTPTYEDGELVVDLNRLERAGLLRHHTVDVRVTLPADSGVRATTGQGDITASGRLGGGVLTTGQGDISIAEANDLTAKTGSGDVSVHQVNGPLDLTTGSGDISVAENSSTVRASTGSGDITLAAIVQDGTVNSGSGDITVSVVQGQAKLSTGSGDLTVSEITSGGLKTNTAAGDISIGVRPGIPVWTDVNTLTGRVSSSLQGAGQPQPGQPHIEIRATTVTGDISLHEVF